MKNNSKKHSKVLIMGSGPAGYTAAIYAARAMLKPILVHGAEPGGQMTTTTDVQNYPGYSDVIQGPWLMDQMKEQAKTVGTDMIQDHVNKVDLSKKPFVAIGDSGQEYTADSIIISTGAQARWLNLKSEQEYRGFGVSGCATCDGFFFKDKEVFVIGGGDSAMEEATFLTKFASSVTIVHRRNEFRASKIMQDKALSNEKIKVIWNAEVLDLIGEPNKNGLEKVVLKDTVSKDETEYKIDGLFLGIGHIPNSHIFKKYLNLDDKGYILTQADSTKTSIDGVFACGDIQDKVYMQAVTAAGTGCMAAIDTEKYLENLH